MKNKTKGIWLKALKETSKHYILSLIIILILAILSLISDNLAILSFIRGGHLTNFGVSEVILGGAITLLAGFLWSFPIALPVLIATLISSFIIYSNLKISKKILFTGLTYLFFGLSVPLFLLIVGINGYYFEGDKEVGFILMIGLYLLIPYSILTISNYLFMHYRNKDILKIKKNGKI